MSADSRPEQGAATLRLTEEEREALRALFDLNYEAILYDATIETVERILAARQSDAGVRGAVEAECRYWWDQPRPGVDLHSIGMWDLAEKIRRALARPAMPEPEATEPENGAETGETP